MAWNMLMLFVLVLLSGCNRRPGRVASPQWDPERLSARAFEKLDVNQDAFLDAAELAAAPGLKSALVNLDEDKDKRISPTEIQRRLEMYRELNVGMQTTSLRVTLNGRPLAGAEVRLIPESFLEGIIEAATGTTDEYGNVIPRMTLDGEEVDAVRVGFYRVEVASPAIKDPKAQKSAAALGVEVSPIADGPQSSGNLELAIRT